MKKISAAAILALALAGFWAGQARALSVEQVIKLRKAGVSNQIIQQMIDTEMAVQRQGGVGRYVAQTGGGREVIVYRASSPRGVVDYPLADGDSPGVNRMSAALGMERRQSTQPVVRKQRSGSGRYSLHLASFRKKANAEKMLAGLKAKGLEARLEDVTIPGKGLWHRVMLGDYQAKAQAQAKGEALHKDGKISNFLVLSR